MPGIYRVNQYSIASLIVAHIANTMRDNVPWKTITVEESVWAMLTPDDVHHLQAVADSKDILLEVVPNRKD